MRYRSTSTVTVPAQRGFTLLEVLVVILVMGLSVGLVSVIVQPDERALLDVEARRLAGLLSLAIVEARYAGAALAWVPQSGSYAFERQQVSGAWEPVRDNDSLRPRQLPAGMQVELQMDPQMDPQRLELSPFGLSDACTIGLSYGAARTQVLLSPLGKVSVAPVVAEAP